jgi:hypothetical protein
MIEAAIIILVGVIVGVNVLTTVSTRFRRWAYKDMK